VAKCNIVNNDVSGGAGGDIYNECIMTITGSTISGNPAENGGGLFSWAY
jgi:hypothetical protein